MIGRHTMPANAHQSGQALVEYIYVFPILLLLILGAIQFGFIYQTKVTLNYATFVAARQGALNNGKMTEIVEGLTAGMLPLFAHSGNNDNKRDMDLLKSAWKLASVQLKDNKLTEITIVNPTAAMYEGFRGQSEGGSEIPNDNLMYRSSALVGNVNIQDANLLKVRVTYCYRMAVPILNKLIYNLAIDPPVTPAIGPTGADMLASKAAGTASGRCTNSPVDEYRIPLTSEAIVRMQSPFTGGKWTGP